MGGVRTTQSRIQKRRKGNPKITGSNRLTIGRAKTKVIKGIAANNNASFVPIFFMAPPLLDNLSQLDFHKIF
jgi:hypothetical protein